MTMKRWHINIINIDVLNAWHLNCHLFYFLNITQHKLLCSYTTPANIYTARCYSFIEILHMVASKSLCVFCVFTCVTLYLCAIQTACRQSRAFPVQTGSAVTVPSVVTKPQGNTMEPPAVTAVKASSDAPYARAMCTPAGTDSEKHVCVCEHTDTRNEREWVCT